MKGTTQYNEFLSKKVENKVRKRNKSTERIKHYTEYHSLNSSKKVQANEKFLTFNTFDDRVMVEGKKETLNDDYDNFIHTTSNTISQDGNNCERKPRRII